MKRADCRRWRTRRQREAFQLLKIGTQYAAVAMRRALDGDHGDIVLLAESLCGFDNGSGRLRRELAAALKAEQFALRVLRFDDAVGIKREAAAGARWNRVVS